MLGLFAGEEGQSSNDLCSNVFIKEVDVWISGVSSEGRLLEQGHCICVGIRDKGKWK